MSNPGREKLMVWLEPWADEFEVPARSTIVMRGPTEISHCGVGEAEWTPDNLVMWASASTVEVLIDGVLQESASATIAVPDGLSKGVLEVLFAGQPGARLGGAAADTIERSSWWRRLTSRFGR
jgi:hypothetical protein